jgi:hypothetical protein
MSEAFPITFNTILEICSGIEDISKKALARDISEGLNFIYDAGKKCGSAGVDCEAKLIKALKRKFLKIYRLDYIRNKVFFDKVSKMCATAYREGVKDGKKEA